MSRKYEINKRWRENNRWFRPLEYARRRCTDPNHRAYRWYGGRGIKCELTYEECRALYIRDNGDSLVRPSLDRLDETKNYTFDNCQFIEWLDNINKGKTTCNSVDEDWGE